MQDICCIIDKKSGRPVCPMQNVEINAVIGSMLAEVTLVQNYANIGNNNIEAMYMFPLPHNAQVTGFKGKIGENKVRGEFREKEEAAAEYEKAVRSGDSAFLLESHRPDIFQISLGNIAPGEKASITITYQEDIEVVDSELRWVLPTVIAPRYIPERYKRYGRRTGIGAAMADDSVTDAEYITPPIGETAYTLKIKAVLSGLNGIRKVSSPSHPAEVLFNGGDVIVSLAKETELLDSDFILSVFLDTEAESSYITAVSRNDTASGIPCSSNEAEDLSGHGSTGSAGESCDESSHNTVSQTGEAFGMTRLIMDMDDYHETQNHYEYTFMIDVSGSMSGEKLKQAKRALIISLRNLLEGDYFNIVAFESNFSCFSKEAVPYSQQNLERADKWIAALTEMGGTEIFEPLRYVLEETVSSQGLERVVLLFTDGQVGNENEIIRLIKMQNRSLQLFPFGIDTAVNKFFIDSLASAGNGIPEYIYPGERIEDKVIRQFSRIHQPYLANPVAFGKNGAELETIPPMPARIFNSEIYSFMMRSENADVLEEIKICGMIEGKNEEIILKSSATGDARLLGLKWAKGKIELLEEQASGNNPRRNALIKKEIVELSIRYSLLSTMTSLVAVHKRIVKGKSIPETIVVPVAKPRGWDMFEDTSDIMYCMAPNIVSEAPMRSYNGSSRTNKLNLPASFKKSMGSRSGNVRAENKVRSSNDTKSELSSVNEIIRKAAQSQKADGTFGSGSEVNRRTSFYIIGMLLLSKEWKPYHIQIIKAGKALLQSDSMDLLLKTVALSLLQEHRLLKAEEVKPVEPQPGVVQEARSGEFQPVEPQTMVDNIAVDEKDAYDTFKSCDLLHLCNIIGYKFTGSLDKKEFASWLLVNAIGKA